MPIVVGLIDAGRVDAVRGEAIRTTFVVVGLPLFPLQSHIGDREIPLSGRSVLAAYARWWLPIGAAVIAYFTRAWEPSAALLALWALSFVWGRPSRQVRLRREALFAATRVSLLPAHLDATCLQAVHRDLSRSVARGWTVTTALALALYHAELAPESEAAPEVIRECEAALGDGPFDVGALDCAVARLMLEAAGVAGHVDERLYGAVAA
jgi:hypothetical protein